MNKFIMSILLIHFSIFTSAQYQINQNTNALDFYTNSIFLEIIPTQVYYAMVNIITWFILLLNITSVIGWRLGLNGKDPEYNLTDYE